MAVGRLRDAVAGTSVDIVDEGIDDERRGHGARFEPIDGRAHGPRSAFAAAQNLRCRVRGEHGTSPAARPRRTTRDGARPSIPKFRRAKGKCQDARPDLRRVEPGPPTASAAKQFFPEATKRDVLRHFPRTTRSVAGAVCRGGRRSNVGWGWDRGAGAIEFALDMSAVASVRVADAFAVGANGKRGEVGIGPASRRRCDARSSAACRLT